MSHNMELMARYPDNYFQLALVNQPYGCELDPEYFAKGMERVNNHIAQQKLF